MDEYLIIPIKFNSDRLIIGCLYVSMSPSGGRGSSAVERATPGEEVPGSIAAVAARSLLVGSVSV